MNQVKILLRKLYGNQKVTTAYLTKHVDAIPTVTETGPRNKRELSWFNHHGYRAEMALKFDSERISYGTVGTRQDAIENAKADINSLANDVLNQQLGVVPEYIQHDEAQIRKLQKLSSDQLYLLRIDDTSKILRPLKATDIEMIYHNTHYSWPEINERHPKIAYYTSQDAEMDAQSDLK